MDFHKDITLADVDRASVLINHNIKAVLNHGDAATAKLIKEKLSVLFDKANDSFKKLSRGKRWKYYCGNCSFEYGENKTGRLQCPMCGEGLRLWSLDRGDNPPRRTLAEFV